MASALIGYSGFVGGNLLRQSAFDDLYRSTNIHDIAGKSYDLIVSAGVSSLKWKANKDPAADRAAIERLMTALSSVRAKLFILISTIDVYNCPLNVDEDSPLIPDEMMPYGRNRWDLEQFVSRHFNAVTVRLPNLFGDGLKKNVIFDLLHQNNVDLIQDEAVLQWYSLDGLWADIQKVLHHRIPLINIAAEPWSTRDLTREVFGIDLDNHRPGPAPRYDFRSKYAALWGRTGGYLYGRDDVRERLVQFVARERARLHAS